MAAQARSSSRLADEVKALLTGSLVALGCVPQIAIAPARRSGDTVITITLHEDAAAQPTEQPEPSCPPTGSVRRPLAAAMVDLILGPDGNDFTA